MQPDRFTASGLLIERHLPREGPPYYLVYSGHGSAYAMDAKGAIALAAWPRSTPTGVAVREWLAAHPLGAHPLGAHPLGAHPLAGSAGSEAVAAPAPAGEAGAAPLPLVPPADEPEPGEPEPAEPEPNDNTRTII